MKSLVGPLIKLIVFAVVTVLATALLGLTIANAGGAGSSRFAAVFDDAAMLNPGDDVRISGVKVGEVSSVEVYDRNQAMVRFTLDRDRLPEGTELFIRYRNLTGLRYLALERGPGDLNNTVPDGHVFGTDPNRDDTHSAVNLTELFNGFKPLFRELQPEDVNRLSEQIIAIFQGDRMAGTMSQLVSDTASLTSTIADRDQVIGELIDNLTGVLDTVNRNDEQFKLLLDNTERFVSGLAAQRGSVGSAISSLSNLTAVTGSILGQTRPAIQGDIAGLRALADRINANDEAIDETLTNLPVKLQKIGRAATFGSWFQFYLCGIDVVAGNGKSTVLTHPLIPLPDINHVLYTSAATRCWKDNQRPGG